MRHRRRLYNHSSEPTPWQRYRACRSQTATDPAVWQMILNSPRVDRTHSCRQFLSHPWLRRTGTRDLRYHRPPLSTTLQHLRIVQSSMSVDKPLTIIGKHTTRRLVMDTMLPRCRRLSEKPGTMILRHRTVLEEQRSHFTYTRGFFIISGL